MIILPAIDIIDGKPVRLYQGDYDKKEIVADDIFGGIFVINGGKFNGDLGNVYYFAPDTLEWEDLDLKYSEFIYWAFSGDVKKFYEEFLWDNWEEEFSNIKIENKEYFKHNIGKMHIYLVYNMLIDIRNECIRKGGE